MPKWITYAAITAVVFILFDEITYHYWRRANPGLLYHQSFLLPEGDRSWGQAYKETGRIGNATR